MEIINQPHSGGEGGRAPSSDGAPGRMTGRAPVIDGDKLKRLLSKEALEVRGDGRAGSGLGLTFQAIAAVAISDPALHIQEWPFFSSARKGAPTRGFLRISRSPIGKASEITSPHIAVMMDEGVAKMVDFAQGVAPGSIFILNTVRSPEDAAKRFRLSGTVYTINGDEISARFLKGPIGNISVFALMMEILPGFDPHAGRMVLENLLRKRRLPDALVKANCNLFDASIGQAKSGSFNFAGPSDHRQTSFDGYGNLAPGAQSALRLSRKNLTSAYARSGFVLHFEDPEGICNGCGHCIINCPENIIIFKPDVERGVRVFGADVSNYCKLCRECVAICPKVLFSEKAVEIA